MQSICPILYKCLWPVCVCHTFLHYLMNSMIFRKKVSKHKIVFWLSLLLFPETFLILRRIQWDIILSYQVLHVKYLLFLSDFNKTWPFSTNFQKILEYQISQKSIHWEPRCSMWMDWQTDMMKQIVLFCNFVNIPKKQHLKIPYVAVWEVISEPWLILFKLSESSQTLEKIK